MMNSPITIIDKVSEQIMEQMEDAVMVKVRESCNIEIDKKALFDAISKSTPMKPRVYDRELSGTVCCPVCNELMRIRRISATGQKIYNYPNYCSHCGQRIDWEIENDKL